MHLDDLTVLDTLSRTFTNGHAVIKSPVGGTFL